MNAEVRLRLEELVKAIRSSEEYYAFQEAKRRLDAEPAERHGLEPRANGHSVPKPGVPELILASPGLFADNRFRRVLFH